eukprot:CAMPEP_0185042698 /NCGR_PEP_ID=MMETSP1103-20130426/42501_1 /TAXON_ID=36769 /ORGANISM="Paraphysomonas bandaiensis, Strain Caron Lab Isolate" /LENGTH=85 /DNA_ID=CAMNT_0027582807 /DNA_START=237 /DNA_END=494 /DNA_ORIENTATION=-
MKRTRYMNLRGQRRHGTKVARARAQEVLYREKGVYSEVVDLTTYNDDDETDDECTDNINDGDDEVDVWQEESDEEQEVGVQLQYD